MGSFYRYFGYWNIYMLLIIVLKYTIFVNAVISVTENL